MSPDDGFLSRWSRRKLDAKAPAPSEPEPSAVAADPAEAEPELSPDELAELPKLEDLTADSDIGPFLRKGVPALLRRAALRRVWELDPAIRDYVGDARDYAYDWNVAGGVPGTGPLLPTDDVGATLARMFNKAAPDEADPDGAAQTPFAAARPEDEAGAEGQESRAALSDAGAEEGALPAPGADPNLPGLTDAPAPKIAPARRHGGAVPV